MNERFENINLLRAFAAVAVVVYHVITYMKWDAFPISGPLVAFRIGWIGVDLFFVISGFVITRSALALWRRDADAFRRRYWAHRVSRIVPLYVLTCALWIVLFMPDFWDQRLLRALWQIAAHLTFTHTFWPFTYSAIDGVNWTLGIEMQFYLLVAALIPWIARTRGSRILLGCIVIALVWRATMVYFFIDFGPTRLFMTLMQLPGTLDEFGAGIFLALWLDRRPPHRLEGWIWTLGAIAAGTFCMSVYWSHSGYWDDPRMIIFWRTLLGAFFLCVVAAAVHLPPIARTWPLRPVWYLGEVSYGIYLWHMFAVTLCLRITDLTPLQALGITLSVTLLLASASWHFFERPILEYGRRFHGSGVPRRQSAAASGS